MARKPPRTRKGRGATAPKAVRLPRIAKGRRPEFFDEPAIDQLFAIVTALTGEISVLYDRLDTMERLLAEAGVVPEEAIASYMPDATAADFRRERRDELLQRVFAVLEHHAGRKAAQAP